MLIDFLLKIIINRIKWILNQKSKHSASVDLVKSKLLTRNTFVVLLLTRQTILTAIITYL